MEAVYDKDKAIEELKEINSALIEKLTFLNKRKMARNDKATNKWRNQAFYYKNKCSRMINALLKQGLEVTDEGSIRRVVSRQANRQESDSKLSINPQE